MDTHAANRSPLCALCGSANQRGELRLTLDGGASAHIHRLCSPCFGLLRATLLAAIDHPHGASGPRRPVAEPGTAGASCAMCRGPHGESDGPPIELVPIATTFGPILETPEPALVIEACAPCRIRAWHMVEEEMVARKAARTFAAIEAGPGQAIDLRCLALGLPPAETSLLRTTTESLGGTMDSAQSWDDAAPGGRIIFAWASAVLAGDAEKLPAGALARTVVVTAPAQVGHALRLMRAGARDLLVSPLSRQQVLGALDRMGDPGAAAGRDAETGIVSYRPAPRFGLPCHLVTVELPDGLRGIDAYLVLRRFLRGYDRVGLDSGTLLPVALFCDPSDLENVVGRIRAVLGPDCSVSVLATVTEFPRLEEAWVDDLDPAALRRFGLAG